MLLIDYLNIYNDDGKSTKALYLNEIVMKNRYKE